MENNNAPLNLTRSSGINQQLVTTSEALLKDRAAEFKVGIRRTLTRGY